jgi:methyl-accepting chemotaxis protein
MAHEMGMTVRDLTDMVSKGNLDALTGLTALFEGWAKKHKGAAETFAGSMSGLWNQLKLQYELFKNDMMSSGDSFITLKAGLKTVLDLVKRWREDGSIVEWSEHAVKAMWVVVEGIHYIGKAFLGWKIIWEGLKAAGDTTVAGIYASMAWLADKMGILLEKLADVQEFLNFDATADRTRIAAAGMREWADETSNVADVLIDDIATEGVKGIEDAVAAIINLDQKTAQLKASFYENVEALKAQAKAGKDAGSAMAEGTDETAKAIEKLDPKLEAAHQKLHDFLAIHSQADDAARSIAKLNIEYDRMAELLTDMQLAGYDVVEMSEQLERWYANSMDEITNKTEATTDKVYDAWSHMYERLQDVTADWIYDMKVDFDSIVDLFKRSVAEMISAWIWGQQNMQFATSGPGGFSLGGMFGGMLGGGGAGGGGQTAAQAAMAAGYGPVAEEWALANGFTNTLQGAQSAYSLYGAYGAYQGAGGGWAGAKAGAGSFFGGGSASSLTYASWIAAAVIVAAQVLGKYNAEHGYGRIEGTPQGYNVSQTMHPFAGGDWASSSWLTDPAANWLRGISGDKSPSGSDWFAYHLKEGNWEDAFFASFESALEWSNIGLAQTQRKLMEILGIPGPGEILGYSNKKRSYLTRDYDYTYDLAEGWSDPSMTHIRSKRGGEDAFGEAADWMSEGVSSILNSIEELTTGFLGAVDEKWVNQFKTSMMSLGELGFKFNISAEDEDEFADDMEKSFSAALDGVINPVMA